MPDHLVSGFLILWQSIVLRSPMQAPDRTLQTLTGCTSRLWISLWLNPFMFACSDQDDGGMIS